MDHGHCVSRLSVDRFGWVNVYDCPHLRQHQRADIFATSWIQCVGSGMIIFCPIADRPAGRSHALATVPILFSVRVR